MQPMTSLKVFFQTVQVELQLFVRNPTTPTIVAILLGLSILLLPTSDAAYTILSFSGAKPLMDENTYLFAAGIILSTLIFPYFILAFGTGAQRDNEARVGSLFLGQKHFYLKLILARLLSNNLKVLILNILVLLFLAIIILIRLQHPPSLYAVLLFCVLSTLSGAIAVALAMVTEHLFGRARNLLIVATFIIWFAVLFLYQGNLIDVFGLSLIVSAVPAEHSENGMSFGVIAGVAVNSFEWYQLPRLKDFVDFVQLNLMYVAALNLIILAFLHIPINQSAKNTFVNTSSEKPILEPSEFARFSLSPGSSSSMLVACKGLLKIFLTNNRFVILMGVITFSFGMTSSGEMSLLLPFWLSAVFFIFQRQKMTQTAETLLLEHSIASLKSPSPELVKLVVLSFLLFVPLLPVILQLPILQSIQFLLAMIYLLAWMLLSFSIWRRPVLGMSVFAIFWYVFGLNKMPASLDLLAIQGHSAIALMSNLIIFSAVLSILIKASRSYFIK